MTAVNLNSASVKDGAGNAANLAGVVTNPSGTLQISAAASSGPVVASVVASGSGITAGNGDLKAGSVVTLAVNLSGAVTVAGGTPTLTLNDGGTATYKSGSGTGALTFSYTVSAGQNVSDLAVAAVNLNGATIKDGAGNAANLAGAVSNPSGTLTIDTSTPAVSSITESPVLGALGAGQVVTYTIGMNEVVTVNTAGGSPTLSFNDGGTATYVSGSGTKALTFKYTVMPGENTADLMISTFKLNGATIADGAGNAANLSLAGIPQGSPSVDTKTPTVASVVTSGAGITSGRGDIAAGTTVMLTVNLSEAVMVAGGTPTLTLNDGGTATLTGGSGTNALTFSYTVAAGQNTPDLSVKAINLNGATVKDGAGNAADLTGAVTNPSGTLQVDTSAHLTHVGNQYYLYNGAGVGPSLKSDGTAITDSQLGSWSFIGAVQVGTGYEVALHLQGTDQYTVWSTDSNGNVLSDVSGGNISGSSAALEAFETSFHQDLNGDGTIGVTTSVIEASGSTALVQSGDNYFLNPVGGGTGPELEYSGSPVTVDQIAGWSFIGAERTSSGYEIAMKATGSDQYTVWNTDTSGNFTSIVLNGVSGSSSALEALETSFHQDLNGDGTIGLPTKVIEASGNTALDQVGNNYYLNPVSGGTGPELKNGGSAVTVDQIAGWTFIGAEKISTGYEVALKATGSNQYSVVDTDSNGNITSTVLNGVAGSNSALQALEASFHQDLNGDGIIFLSGSGSSIGTNSLVVGSGASVELTGAYSGTVSFAGATGTLEIDQRPALAVKLPVNSRSATRLTLPTSRRDQRRQSHTRATNRPAR